MKDYANISRGDAMALQLHLGDKYGLIFVEHDDNPLIGAVRTGLKAALGVAGLASAVDPALDAILGERSFTFGKFVALNPAVRASGAERRRTVLHEGKHGHQLARDGLGAAYLYLVYQERMHRMEVEAYVVEVAVDYYFLGPDALPKTLDDFLAPLRGPLYRFTDEGVGHARTLCAQKLSTIADGLTVDPYARDAIEFLERLGYARHHAVPHPDGPA